MTVVNRDNSVDLGTQARLRQVDAPGYADILTEATAQAGYVGARRATLAHSDTTAKELFQLPAGAVILGFIINVTTAFDDSGSSDIIDIGDGTTADAYVADFDCGATGMTLAPSADETALSAATTIEGVYTPGTGATAGAATITCLFLVPPSA